MTRLLAPLVPPPRVQRALAVLGVLVGVGALIFGTALFLRWEDRRYAEPAASDVRVPDLPRALLEEFAARVPP